MKGMNVCHYALSYDDCSIRVHRLFTTILHKCLILILLLKYIIYFPVMLALCLMLSMTYYAENYAGIIGGSLDTPHYCISYYNVASILIVHEHPIGSSNLKAKLYLYN